MIPQLFSFLWSNSFVLNRLSLFLSLTMWVTYTIRSLKRNYLAWIYLTVGIINSLIILLLLIYYNDNSKSNEPQQSTMNKHLQPEFPNPLPNYVVPLPNTLPPKVSFNLTDYAGRPMMKTNIYPK